MMKLFTRLLQAYEYGLQKQSEKVFEILEETRTTVRETAAIDVKALWLYVFVTASSAPERDGAWAPDVNALTDDLVEGWKQPAANVWGERGLHISNLGMVYGALSAVKRWTGRSVLQKTLTEIRDDVFDRGLSGGTLIRSPEDKQVSTDLLATVMPFGLFSPEDLAMVEAVGVMEEHLVLADGVYRWRGDVSPCPASAAWLSWYFTEKGDETKARYYRHIAEATKQEATDNDGRGELADVLLRIVDYFLEEQLGDQASVSVLHFPYGNDNPYEPQSTERFPHDPEEGEQVTVGVKLYPEAPEHVLWVVFGTDQQTERTVQARREEKDGETLWKADIGGFAFGERVTYRFVVENDGRTIVESDRFSFEPRRTNHVRAVRYMGKRDGEYRFQGLDLDDRPRVSLALALTEQGLQFRTDVNERPKPSVGTDDDEPEVWIEENGLQIQVKKQPFTVTVKNRQGQTLLQGYPEMFPVLQWLENARLETSRLIWNFLSAPEEVFYGLGERYHRLELKEEVIDCYVYNQYRDQGNRTYMPVPYFISSKGYGMWFQTEEYSVFHLGHPFKDLWSASCDLPREDPSLTFHLFTGKPQEITSRFSERTGKPVLPPVWAFGPWMSSNNWDRESVVRAQVEATNRHQIPATVIVLEQWSDEATYYIFNDAEYDVKDGGDAHRYEDFHFPEWGRWPDPKGLVEELHANNLKLILWQIPIQKYLNRQTHLQKDEDERYMLEKGYAVKHSDGTPYRMPEGWFKESLLMDYTHPEGCEWWFDKRRYLLDIGVDGFKTDGGEFVFGRDLQFADGSDGAKMRNRYPNDYIEAYYRFATAYHDGDAMTFSRAGYTGAQNFPAHWAGDERSTFDAFRHSLIAGLSSGISGIPFWGWDLAGFNGDIPTAELFIRSAQMAAFCPIMQYHAESKAEFNQDRTPWNIADRTGDDRALAGYRTYANVRMNLLPYIYDQAVRTSREGIPMMRAMMMEFPEDQRCHAMFDQYMFGEKLLVAPVIEEGAVERKVYFPHGTWFDIWTGKRFEGPAWKRIPASLMEIPVFVRGDGVLLTNSEATGQLGAWVGNRWDVFQVPVLRLYPTRGIDEEIRDHLGQHWHVRAVREEEQWDITVDSPQENARLAVPQTAVDSGATIRINGRMIPLQEEPLQDGCYILKL